jgi:hypothetical protein
VLPELLLDPPELLPALEPDEAAPESDPELDPPELELELASEPVCPLAVPEPQLMALPRRAKAATPVSAARYEKMWGFFIRKT